MDEMNQEAGRSFVRVEIFGHEFGLDGDLDYIKQLAEYVDFHMRWIRDNSAPTARVRLQNPTADDIAHLAIRAALNITDEFANHSPEWEEWREWEENPPGEETEPPGETVPRSQADNLSWRPPRKPAPKPMSEEDRQRVREQRQRHYTKRSHEKRLLAIANDESLPAKDRLEALLALGRSRGYHRASKTKR